MLITFTIRLNEAEEDEFVMWSQYASDICINDSPTLIDLGPKDIPKIEFWTPEQQFGTDVVQACIQKRWNEKGTGLYVGKIQDFAILPQLNTVFQNQKSSYWFGIH